MISSFSYSYKYNEKNSVNKVADGLYDMIMRFGYEEGREIVIIGVGTDRSTGDSLGPFVGKYLMKMNVSNVYGTIRNTIHNQNLDNIIASIYQFYDNPFIIPVDAGLGREESVGNIDIIEGELKPGTGVGKEDISSFGEIHITGIVNISGGYLVLQATELYKVMDIAKIIAKAISKTVKKIEKGEKEYEIGSCPREKIEDEEGEESVFSRWNNWLSELAK